MDNITIFHYRAKETAIHVFNPIFKLIFMILFSISVIFVKTESLFALFLIIVFLFLNSKMKIISVLKQAQIFFILLLFMFFSYAFINEGEILLSFHWFKIYDTSSIKGAIYCFRFTLILICGLIFTETTSPYDIQAAVYYLIKPIPFVNEKRISSIAGITFTLLPKILDNYNELKFALESRGMSLNKNIYSKMKFLVSSLLLRGIFTIKNLANSYYSRCYDEESLQYNIFFKIKDIIISLILILILISIIILNYFLF